MNLDRILKHVDAADTFTAMARQCNVLQQDIDARKKRIADIQAEVDAISSAREKIVIQMAQEMTPGEMRTVVFDKTVAVCKRDYRGNLTVTKTRLERDR